MRNYWNIGFTCLFYLSKIVVLLFLLAKKIIYKITLKLIVQETDLKLFSYCHDNSVRTRVK